MANFEIAKNETLLKEGKYSNRPEDAGGETKYGITIRVAREEGYEGAMIDFPIELADRIYKKLYWDKLKLDLVSSQPIANELFDTAVNCGAMTASIFLQRVLNVLNREARDWEDIKVDGIVGAKTIGTLEIASRKREKNILLFLNVLQGARYIELATTSSRHDELNINGWAQRITLNY